MTPGMFRSLRARYYAAVVGVATLPILVLGLTSAQRAATNLEHQSLVLQTALAYSVTREIESFVDIRLNELRVFERTNPLIAMDDVALTAAISRLLAHDQVYQALTVLDLAGSRHAYVSRTSANVSDPKTTQVESYAQPEYWHGRSHHIGHVEFDSVLREPLLDVAVPVIERRTGKVVRVLLASVRFVHVWNLLNNVDLPDAADAFVVAQGGQVVAHRLAAPVLSNTVFELPERSGRGLLAEHRIGLVAFQPLTLGGARGYVVVTRPLESALAAARALRNATLVLTGAMLLAAMLLAMVQSRQVVGPVEVLARAAQRIAKGDLGAPIEVAGPSEIRALGRVLQQMTTRLTGTITQLERSGYIDRQRAIVTLDSIGDAVVTTDEHGETTYLNPVASTLTGWSLASAQGQPIGTLYDIINEETREPASNPVASCLTLAKAVSSGNHTALRNRNGQEYAVQDSAAPIREADGKVVGAVLVFRDVSEERVKQHRIIRQATYDSLTGLVNRRGFEDHLDRVLETVGDGTSEHALCYLDLDRFKIVNDTCGHAAGDELLRRIAALLKQTVRRRDTLARLGGDEFAVLMENCSLEHATRVAEEIRGAVERLRFRWLDRTFTVGVSIGLTSIAKPGQKRAAVMKAADNACYVAKADGRNQVQIHGLDAIVRGREKNWVTTLTRALQEDRFELHAQKIINIRGRDARYADSVEHVDMLLRLVDQDGTCIAPAAFLLHAERCNLITRIDRWVIERTIRWLAEHPRGSSPLLCSVNVSRASICESSFVDFVLASLDRAGIAGSCLCFEVAEPVALDHLTMVTRFVAAIRSRGCQFALTGFSGGTLSWNCLSTLPVQYVKIDDELITDIATNTFNFTMVRVINEVSKALGTRTIATSVESGEVLEKLTALGVDAALGLHMGNPEQIILQAGLATPRIQSGSEPRPEPIGDRAQGLRMVEVDPDSWTLA